MQWTDEQVNRLEKLCFAGRSDMYIALALKCELRDVYAKRILLGITAEECKEQMDKPEPKASIFDHGAAVRKAFNDLHMELLLGIAYEGTSDKDAALYGYMAEAVTALASLVNAMRGGK